MTKLRGAGSRWTRPAEVRAPRQKPQEVEKRAQLQAELEADKLRPLTPGVSISPHEKDAIAIKVRIGKIQQSGFPGAVSSGGKGRN